MKRATTRKAAARKAAQPKPQPQATSEDQANRPVSQKVVWQKLKPTDILQLGDFWASVDPNTPHLQGRNGYLLELRPVFATHYGQQSKTVLRKGHYWRPVGISTSFPALAKQK